MSKKIDKINENLFLMFSLDKYKEIYKKNGYLYIQGQKVCKLYSFLLKGLHFDCDIEDLVILKNIQNKYFLTCKKNFTLKVELKDF